MPTVLILPEMMREVQAPYVDVLRDAGFQVRYPSNPLVARGRCDAAETISELAVADATLASVERYDEATLSELPKLRVIARAGVGYDRIDVSAATARKIAVAITPTANHEAVAELALSLMFAVSKLLVPNDRRIRAGQWPRQPLVPLRQRTLGIFGLGRIGCSLAKRAVALGMKVIATETQPNMEFVRAQQLELVDFNRLLSESDYLSVHCPLNDETAGLFDKRAFASMKSTSFFINTARGPLVVESDLEHALKSGQLAGAGLDVLAQEPPAANNPLFELDNVVFSPHLAGLDELSLEAMGVEAATSIVKLFRGEWPGAAIVNQELQSDWRWE